jgi:hypothetical protein
MPAFDTNLPTAILFELHVNDTSPNPSHQNDDRTRLLLHLLGTTKLIRLRLTDSFSKSMPFQPSQRAIYFIVQVLFCYAASHLHDAYDASFRDPPPTFGPIGIKCAKFHGPRMDVDGGGPLSIFDSFKDMLTVG